MYNIVGTCHLGVLELANKENTMTLDKIIDDLYMIGFNSTFGKPANNAFPFYNVLKLDEDSYLIQIALAGFDEDLIEISEQKSTLIVNGTRPFDISGEYLWKGISAKSFTRSFALAEHVHVESAKLEKGMLNIRLKRDVPEEAKPKRIAIEAA